MVLALALIYLWVGWVGLFVFASTAMDTTLYRVTMGAGVVGALVVSEIVVWLLNRLFRVHRRLPTMCWAMGRTNTMPRIETTRRIRRAASPSFLMANVCAVMIIAMALPMAPRALADGPETLFACDFDGGLVADRARGRAKPTAATGVEFVDGVQGQAVYFAVGDALATVTYATGDNINAQRGAIEFAIRLDWDYTQSTSRAKRNIFDIGGRGRGNRLYLHALGNALVFGVFDDTAVVHAVYAPSVTTWNAGEWHRVTCAWDLPRRYLAIALDGQLASDVPTQRERGSWRIEAGALTRTQLGALGSSRTALAGAIDELRIQNSARLLDNAGGRSPAADRDLIAAARRQATSALRELNHAIADAERNGIDASYAAAVATTAGVGLWRLTESPLTPSPEDARAYGDYIQTRCREAAAQLADSARDRRWERRVPRPSVLALSVDGDTFRTDDGEEVLLVGIRNTQVREFTELARFFNLITWNSGAPERWVALTKQDNYAGQAILFWMQPTRAAVDAHPEMRNVGGWSGHNWAQNLCVEADRSRKVIGNAIDNLRILGRKQESAAAYVLLSAEDEYMCYCDRSLAMFRDWLRSEYGSIAMLNSVWRTQATSFDELTPPRWAKRRITPDIRAGWYDWQRFNRARTTAFYAWLKQRVRRHWPTAPVCGGRHLHLADNRWGAVGVDTEALNAGVNDVAQCETLYDPPTRAVAHDLPAYGMDLFGEAYLDFQRATCGKPATDLEYHAWLRYAAALAAQHAKLPANYTYAAILRHYLHGIRAANIWVWERTPRGARFPASFAASPTIPLASVEECLRAALDVQRLSRDIIALSGAPRQVAIMVSDASFLQVHPSFARGQVDSPLTAELDNVYHGSMFLDTPVGFVSERSIARGALADYRVVLVPAISHIDDATLASLLHFVDGGGTLVVTPRSFFFDPYNRPRPVVEGFPSTQDITFVGLLDEPTSAQLRDPEFIERHTVVPGDPRVPTATMIMTDDAPAGLAGQRLEGAGIRLGLSSEGGAVIARFADNGRPAIVRRDRGKGRIFYGAIPLCPQSYARFVDPILRDAGVERPIRLRSETGAPLWGVEARSVRVGDDLLVYAINLLAAPVDVRLSCARRILGVHDLLSNRPGSASLRLDAMGTTILRLKVAR